MERARICPMLLYPKCYR